MILLTRSSLRFLRPSDTGARPATTISFFALAQRFCETAENETGQCGSTGRRNPRHSRGLDPTLQAGPTSRNRPANSVRSGKSCRPCNVVSVRLASIRTALRLDPNVRDPIPYYMLQNGGCASASSTARDAQNRAVSSGPIMISAPPEPDILGRRSGRASLLSLAALERHGLGRLVVVEAHDVRPSSRYSV